MEVRRVGRREIGARPAGSANHAAEGVEGQRVCVNGSQRRRRPHVCEESPFRVVAPRLEQPIHCRRANHRAVDAPCEVVAVPVPVAARICDGGERTKLRMVVVGEYVTARQLKCLAPPLEIVVVVEREGIVEA